MAKMLREGVGEVEYKYCLPMIRRIEDLIPTR